MDDKLHCYVFQQKNLLYKKYLRQPTVKSENNYKQFKNKLNHVIKIANKKCYEEQLVKYKYDTKLLWKTLNKIMSKHEKNRSLPKEFIADSFERIISDPQTIAVECWTRYSQQNSEK